MVRNGFVLHKDVTIPGRGADHRTDGYGNYSFQVPFIYPIRLIAEAKAYKNPLEPKYMRSFIGLVKDISECYFPCSDTFGGKKPASIDEIYPQGSSVAFDVAQTIDAYLEKRK